MATFFDRLNAQVWAFRNKFSPVPDYEFDSQGELHQFYTPIQWTPSAIVSLAVSGFVGIFLGIFIALCVNTALIEVSVSTSFALVSCCRILLKN